MTEPLPCVDSLFRLDGQVAVVTGGLGRLGSQYTRTLLAAGASVAAFDVHLRPNTIVDALVAAGRPVSTHAVDVTDRIAVDLAMADIVRRFGTPAILVNNAGLGSPPNASAAENGPFEDYPEASWDAMLDSHLKGAFIVSQSFIKTFKEAPRSDGTPAPFGSIINVSSTYGVVTPDQSVYNYRRRGGVAYYKPVGYSVAKSGVLNFTRWLAEYCAPFGLRVNTLVPGGVREPDHAPEFVAEYVRRTPLGRMANDDDYNGAVLFLASRASAYMTGATLVVDGGWTAR
jgi:NAD(P)-dependent dehydrogenase (short-subunit alcohol dehydrogenase family)